MLQRLVDGSASTLGELLNRVEEPFRTAITQDRVLMFDIIEMLDHASNFPLRHVYQAAIQRGFRHHWGVGICNGTIEVSSLRSWADFHVTGELGGSLDKAVLIERLDFIRHLFTVAGTYTGVEGEIELHPTGAVVTKQLITLVAQACGSSYSNFKALTAMKWRKLGKQPERNKLAAKIDDDMLSEYFSFLKSLRGIAGLKIVPTGAMPLPKGIRSMREDQQVAELERNMLENSESGTNRFSQYREAYVQSSGEAIPSMKVFIRARHIPALLQVLRSV